MSDQTYAPSESGGRTAPFIVYALYLLSIPSAAIFALIGVIVAYAARAGASPAARPHIEEQIRIWWIAFAWGVALFVVAMLGWLLTFILIGFPILWIAAGLGFIVMVWFTAKSALGLIALLDDRAP